MPRLYVVPTPIGNLEDITLRGLRVLREVSLILAEDTRHTGRLLRHFDIPTPLLSYHQHNKKTRVDDILARLERADVALVSDAGMPSISDPGFELISACLDAGIEVDVLPGPSALTTAVTAAAIPAPGFTFMGFLPRRRGERKTQLEHVRDLPYALVLFEAPHRLLAALGDLQSVLGDRSMAAARELTKVHQEIVRGSITAVRTHFEIHPPRGEFTLVIAGNAGEPDRMDEALTELRRRQAAGENRKAVIDALSGEFGVGRNALYSAWIGRECEG